MEEHDNEKKPFSLMEYFLGFSRKLLGKGG